ncbi:MAG TPA: alpha/beta fold hydrolase [Solirubrobacterales bacterium]|jgi:pimeloyl-ACP methyl ester carboxylesterase
MAAIAVTRAGSGPPVLLVHGGASPAGTWESLAPLASEWTLVSAHRRGYPPSPPGRHDFDQDALDLAPLLEPRTHLVAHSYGGLGALLAAAADPERVRSLTLVEPPLFSIVEGDPDVEELERLGDAFLTEGLDADPAALREFLRIAGVQEVPDGPLPERIRNWVRRAQGGRLPGGARPDLDAIARAGIPSLIASGCHSRGQERICDALAGRLGGARLRVEGGGHFVQRSPTFVQELALHLRSAEGGAVG